MNERLQKFLARAGVASRRACETIIREGRVTVNGAVVREMGTKVDPDHDSVKLDGRRIRVPERAAVVLALNKPSGYVTTLDDPQNRPTIADLIRGIRRRVYPVGRLDFHTEGLLLLTDDGDLARDLTHPRSGVPKTYRVKVRGNPDDETLGRLAAGIVLDGRRTAPARIRRLRSAPNAWLLITVTEGRNRLVRRMLQAVGHPVQKLRRTAFGPIGLGTLTPGAHRRLSPSEIRSLREAVGGPKRHLRRPPGNSGRRTSRSS